MALFVRWKVVLDATAMVTGIATGIRDAGPVKVLALPAGADPRGESYARLLQSPRDQSGVTAVDLQLRDYLPGYARKLVSDLEASLARGNCVYLWEGEDGVRLVGYPFESTGAAPWTDTEQWYQTASDALHKHRPVAMEILP